MNNFFFRGEDYSLFRKALNETKGEPVIINLLSTDSSLNEAPKQEEAPVVRKNLSNKFQPSPFGKFFGPRKQRTTPVDMGNFSSWKNKNFRETEQKLGQETVDTPKFSLSDYMNKNAGEKKFNDEDQLKTDTQKPITQLSTSDPTYQKYSLDSYLHKLEEQSKVKNKFEQNDDLLEPLGGDTQMVVPDSSQDENFTSSSSVNIEDVSFDENISGERFAFEKSELDKVRTRLDKLEKEASNIKDKPTEKVISSNELSDLTKDDTFDLDKLGVSDDEDEIEVDDIEKINEKLASQESETEDSIEKETPKVTHKKFFEINKNSAAEGFKKPSVEQDAGLFDEEDDLTDDTDESLESNFEETDSDDNIDETDENIDSISEDAEQGESEVITDDSDNEEPILGEPGEFVSGTKINRDDILTKEDFKSITDEFMAKFTELYKKGSTPETQTTTQQIVTGEASPEGVNQGYIAGTEQISDTQGMVDGYQYDYSQADPYLQKQHAELQAKILEMIEQNKKSDAEAEEKLRQAEIDKQKVTEEYESRLRELEQSFKKRDEEIKKQAYLDKLKNDIKLKKAESKYKRREEEMSEMHRASSEMLKIGVVLKKELKNNLNISNLEMDKKLLEVASKIRKEELEEQKEITQNVEDVVEVAEEEVVEEKPKKAPAKKPAPRKKTTRRTHSHTRTPRRKIDSDIIGGIKFD